jgi:SAM-dependent methyltransferase
MMPGDRDQFADASEAPAPSRSDERSGAAHERRTSCPVCASAPRALRGHGAADAWLCPSCGHTFIATLPTPAELDTVYATYGYDQLASSPPPAFLDVILETLLARFDHYRRRGRLLDVGFGAGGLLRVARDRGWSTHGVETSPTAVEVGRVAGLGTLHHGDFLQVDLERGSYDVVVMTELIEHLPVPMPFLLRASEMLRPGGLLYMTTPHGRGLSGRLLGASWSVLKPPEHLQLFSIRSMRLSLEQAGFTRPRVYTQGLLPHELLEKLLRRQRSSPTSGDPAQVESSVTKAFRMNEALTGRTIGRAAKTTANAALRVSSLGDSLRVEAER